MKKNLKLLSIIFSLIILGYVIVINILSQKNFARIDLTQNKIFSISQATKNKLRSLDDILTIELYFSNNLPQNFKKVQSDIKDLMDEFKIAAGRNIKIVWKDPLKKTSDKEDAIALNIPAIRVQSIEKDKIEMVDGYMGIALRFAGKSESIPLVQESDNFEYEIVQRIFRLTSTNLPMVGIVKTDTAAYIDPRIAEWYDVEVKEDRTHQRFRPIFQSLSSFYNVQYIDFAQDTAIDPAISTIIIPGEDEANYFNNTNAIVAIDQYLMRGGNVIVLAQKFAINLQKSTNASVSNTFLYKMLEKWGVVVKSEMIIDASAGQIIVPQQVGSTVRNVPMSYPMFVRVVENGFNRNVAPLASMTQITFPWATPVLLSENIDSATIADTLIMSSAYSTTRIPPFRIDPNQNWEFHFNNAQNGGRLKPYPLAIRLSGKINSVFSDTTLERPKDKDLLFSTTNGSAIIVGNADFASADAGAVQNMPLILNLVDWLTLDDNLIAVRSRNMIDRSLKNITITGNDESDFTTITKVLNLVLMPIVLIIAGLLLLLNRKKQQERKK